MFGTGDKLDDIPPKHDLNRRTGLHDFLQRPLNKIGIDEQIVKGQV